MFRGEPEGRYRCTKSMVIAPFWFSMEHIWTAIMPFWLSTDVICSEPFLALYFFHANRAHYWGRIEKEFPSFHETYIQSYDNCYNDLWYRDIKMLEDWPTERKLSANFEPALVLIWYKSSSISLLHSDWYIVGPKIGNNYEGASDLQALASLLASAFPNMFSLNRHECNLYNPEYQFVSYNS